MASLNENIRQLRLQLGINQVEFAARIGVTKQCVSNWENDNVIPSVEMLCKIADFFGVSTDYLLGRSEKRVIDVSDLSDAQIDHIICIVKDLKRTDN